MTCMSPAFLWRRDHETNWKGKVSSLKGQHIWHPNLVAPPERTGRNLFSFCLINRKKKPIFFREVWSGVCSNCALNLRNQHFCGGWKICFFLWNVIRISNSYSFYYNEQMSFSIQTIKTQFKPQTYVKSDAMHQYTSTGQFLAEQGAWKLCWECLISDKYSIFIFPNNFHTYVFSCLPPPPAPTAKFWSQQHINSAEVAMLRPELAVKQSRIYVRYRYQNMTEHSLIRAGLKLHHLNFRRSYV